MSESNAIPVPARIVVIEDTAAIREEVADILGLEGFEVHVAADGREGLTVIAAVQPDVVLCDIMMPTMDGHATLAALRESPRWATLPFVFLTARADRGDVRRGMELGADDYLTKPFTADELLTAVRSALDKRARIQHESEERVNTLRAELSDTLPHELRTPLNIIAGYAEMLAEGARTLDSDAIETLARNLLVGTRRLTRLTENVLLTAQLDVLELEADVPPRGRATPCRVVVAEAGTTIAATYDRGADIEIDLEPTATVGIDEVSLHKIVEELVDNACKFSQPGTLIRIQGGPIPGGFRLEVQDAGCGMPPEAVRRIGAYMQFDRRQREQQGLGLGLSIASRLARLHGGSLHIESNGEAAGLTVRIELPAPASETPERPQKVVDGDRLA